MKRIICLLLCAMLLISMSISTAAALPNDTVQPLWQNMNNATITMGFSGDTGSVVAMVTRISGVTTKIEGTLTIYEKDGNEWVYLDSIEDSSTRSLSLSLDFDATSGTEYKAVLDVTAYSETSSESDTLTKTKTCP